ncbi:unnamed protein product [Effrenium voratum]|nr:unnamed protein product [Effrenium voratum]
MFAGGRARPVSSVVVAQGPSARPQEGNPLAARGRFCGPHVHGGRLHRTPAAAADRQRAPCLGELRYKLPASPERTLQELREALSWLRAQGFEKVLLAGDSAGGYLALQGLLAEDTPGAVAGMMLCPWLDLALSGKSHHSNAERCFLHPRWLEASRAQFLQGKALASTWLEPSEKLRARPAFLVCSQGDALRDDTFLFAREAERQNLPLQLREVAGFHDSMLVPGFFDASHVQLFEDLAAFTAEHLSDRLGQGSKTPLARLKPLLVLASGELRMALEGYGSKEGLCAACMMLEAAVVALGKDSEELEQGNLEEANTSLPMKKVPQRVLNVGANLLNTNACWIGPSVAPVFGYTSAWRAHPQAQALATAVATDPAPSIRTFRRGGWTSGDLRQEEARELELVADGPPVTLGRSSKTAVQVILTGVSNTHVELRLLTKPESGPPSFQHLRVRDVSSNGTGLQEPSASKPAKLKKDVDSPLTEGSVIIFPLRTKLKTDEEGQAKIAVFTSKGEPEIQADAPTPPVPVPAPPPPPIPEEVPVPPEPRVQTLPGADEILQLEKLDLSMAKEAETPPKAEVRQEELPEPAKAAEEDDSSDEDSIHAAKKQAAKDLVKKLQEKQRKKEEEKEAEAEAEKASAKKDESDDSSDSDAKPKKKPAKTDKKSDDSDDSDDKKKTAATKKRASSSDSGDNKKKAAAKKRASSADSGDKKKKAAAKKRAPSSDSDAKKKKVVAKQRASSSDSDAKKKKVVAKKRASSSDAGTKRKKAGSESDAPKKRRQSASSKGRSKSRRKSRSRRRSRRNRSRKRSRSHRKKRSRSHRKKRSRSHRSRKRSARRNRSRSRRRRSRSEKRKSPRRSPPKQEEKPKERAKSASKEKARKDSDSESEKPKEPREKEKEPPEEPKEKTEVEDYLKEPVDKIVGSEDKKKSEDEKSTQKSAIVNPFHARLIAKHQQEAVEKAKQEVEAKAKAQAALRLEFENSCIGAELAGTAIHAVLTCVYACVCVCRISGATAKAASRPPQSLEQAQAGAVSNASMMMGQMPGMMGMDMMGMAGMGMQGMGMYGMYGMGYDMMGMANPMMGMDAQTLAAAQAAQAAQAAGGVPPPPPPPPLTG